MNYNRSGFFHSLSLKTKKILLIVLLFFISIFLVFSNFNNSFFAKGARIVTSDHAYYLSSLIISPVNMLIKGYERVDLIKSIYEENQSLKQSQLNESISFQEIVSMKLKIQKYENLINLFDESDYSYISTRIITKLQNNYINTVILNSGKNNNIIAGMPILGFKGLLGFVDRVNNKTSVGILLSDINSRVPVSISAYDFQGILVGQNHNSPIIEFAKNKELIKVGDRVSTSGKGGIFPPYIIIGEISEVKKNSIKVNLLEDLTQLTHVRLIKFN